MRVRQIPHLLFVAGLLFATTAQAGCPNPNASGGGSPEGAVVYNAAHKTMQFCDGTTWWAMKNGGGLPSCADGDTMVMTSSGWGCGSGGGGCTAPASCPNVGDVCSDGSLFAGFMIYGKSSCEPLYVTDSNQSAATQWKTTAGGDDISTNDHVDGKVNHANLGGTLSDFPAFDLCESNTYHGKSDWYLPARNELHLLWLNRAAIDANAAGNFTTGYFWSSTESTNGDAYYQTFGTNSTQTYDDKSLDSVVRCVRRD